MNQKKLKAVFADVLLPLGYTNVKNTFFRRLDDVFTIVDLQKSNFGGRYYVNVGLFIDDGAKLTQPPPFHETHLIQRLEAIVPQSVRDTLAPALDLEVAMGATERSAVISNALEQYGVPFLNSLSTTEGIANYLRPENRNFAGVTLALREIISRRTGASNRRKRGMMVTGSGRKKRRRKKRTRLDNTDWQTRIIEPRPLFPFGIREGLPCPDGPVSHTRATK